jgi:hypothetical protein
MHKCGVKLAWVRESDLKLLKVFEEIEPGRKPQVIKRFIKKSLEDGDIKDQQLIYYLRRSRAIPTTRMLKLALTPNKYVMEPEIDD